MNAGGRGASDALSKETHQCPDQPAADEVWNMNEVPLTPPRAWYREDHVTSSNCIEKHTFVKASRFKRECRPRERRTEGAV